MAYIARDPAVEDYFIEMPLADVAARGGVADIFEEGKIVVLQDYRLDVDFEALAGLGKSTESIEDKGLRRKLKKLTGPLFFEGTPPVERNGRLIFDDPVRQALFDVICFGDIDLFERAAGALKHVHEEVLRIFSICFPNYEPFRLIPSLRLTRTLFENLHWDNHGIDDDFHQARIFANLDTRPRIWHVSHRFPEWVRDHYQEHDLGRFAGRDPNEMISFVTGDLLGGTNNIWKDKLPRHRIAFDPGEVWLGESRLISHQIYYGEAAMVYMWFVRAASMADPGHRFNVRMEKVHEEMQGSAKNPVLAV